MAVEAVEELQLGAELEALLGGLVVEVDIALEIEPVAEELGVAHRSTLESVPGSAQAVVDVHAVHQRHLQEGLLYKLLVCTAQQYAVGIGDAAIEEHAAVVLGMGVEVVLQAEVVTVLEVHAVVGHFAEVEVHEAEAVARLVGVPHLGGQCAVVVAVVVLKLHVAVHLSLGHNGRQAGKEDE